MSISIHVPRVEDDGTHAERAFKLNISIHVPRVEDDLMQNLQQVFLYQFQSTSPVWRTTVEDETKLQVPSISIHVPRVEDDAGTVTQAQAMQISIHVPRVEDDLSSLS